MAAWYAHSVGGRSESEWEPLFEHLENVAALAERFASRFNAGAYGYLAGLWHDLGKFRPEFQAKLKGERIQVEHAGAGAALVQSLGKPALLPIAFCIAGHHAGLANFKSNTSAIDASPSASSRKPLLDRLQEGAPVFESLRAVVPANILAAAARASSTPEFRGSDGDSRVQCRRIELLTRLLFSALIDADRLATAAFYARFNDEPTHAMLRQDSLDALLERLRRHQERFRPDDSPVNTLRLEILNACITAAAMQPGRFTLTAPTGGGKTLSAMRFALEHARRHGLRRVIVVIPYTSIIEQNARVYREIFGAGNVLEHHSNLDEERLREDDSEQETRRKLAAENWDAPIVVTTSVQFFDSLFSDHPSRCRKLHNIAKSVVILDEVQTLPPEMLPPILEVLGELSSPRIGCSVVLSTATPPALLRRDEMPFGLADARPILPDAADLAERARRVRVVWRADEPTTYETLAAELAKRPAVLAIVHRRDDARELAEALTGKLGEEETGAERSVFHLSASMCPKHRLAVLEEIRNRLAAKQPCRVVSTQLVEAGVDLDFPVVYRSLAGLDSLAQAAGRCDREGRLTEAKRSAGAIGQEWLGGELVVFRAPSKPPPGVPRLAEATIANMLANRDGRLDIFDPAVCERFFELLYGRVDDDKGNRVQMHRTNLDFVTTALTFKMIESPVRPIVVPWGEGAERIERFRRELSRENQRALQPFVVQVAPYHFNALVSAGVLERLHERVDVLNGIHANQYDERFGLSTKADGVADAEVLVV